MFSESNNEMYKYPTNIQQMSGSIYPNLIFLISLICGNVI